MKKYFTFFFLRSFIFKIIFFLCICGDIKNGFAVSNCSDILNSSLTIETGRNFPADSLQDSALSKTPKIGIRAPFNWDPDLLDDFALINQNQPVYPVKEVYASPPNLLGSPGRAEYELPNTSLLSMREQIRQARSLGIGFHLILNLVSTAGLEYDRDVLKSIRSQLDLLIPEGVSALTVVNDALALNIRNWFPNLPLSTSVNHQINNVETARQLIDFFDFRDLMVPFLQTRNFPLIRDLHKAFPDKMLVVLVNEACIPQCSLQIRHQVYFNHTARVKARGNPPLDVDHLLCGIRKLTDPTMAMKAAWIRPEDIKYLVASGVSLIKLAGRQMPREWIRDTVFMYSQATSTGNLFAHIEQSGITDVEWARYTDKPIFPTHYFIDGTQLNSFIEPFFRGETPCTNPGMGCVPSCTYCAKWTERVVTSPKGAQEKVSHLKMILKNYLDEVDISTRD